MPRNNGYYNGGAVVSSAAQNISLPKQIKCNTCLKPKGTNAFDAARLNDVREKMQKDGFKFNPATMAFVSCMVCRPKNVVELECGWCDKTQVVDNFSSNERKKGTGVAKCRKCVNEIIGIEPGADDSDASDDNGNNSNNSSDDEDDYDDDAATLPGTTLSGLSLGGSNSYGPCSATGGGVPLNASTAGTYTSGRSGNTFASRANTAASSTAGGYQYTTGKAGTTTSDRGGGAPSVSAANTVSNNNNNNRKFAKTPAVPPKQWRPTPGVPPKPILEKIAAPIDDPEDDEDLDEVGVESSDDDDSD